MSVSDMPPDIMELVDPTIELPAGKTPADWLRLLARRLDADRSRVRDLTRFMSGDAPLPEMGANVRASWQKFQRESRTNWAELIVNAVVDRIIPNGILVTGDPKSAKAKQAQRIWRDNHMDAVFVDWLRMGLAFNKSFLTCWKGDDGKAVITADGPETMSAATDPLQPWKVRAAMRWWRDMDVERDYAMVWSSTHWQRFYRSVYINPYSTEEQQRKYHMFASGSWVPEGEPTPTLSDTPPVVIYRNPGGVGEYETHVDLINRINRGTLQRLVISAMQAFRQRGIKGGMLPEKDAEGNAIDYTKVFDASPGALWNLPENLDIWESQQTDVRPILDESKDDIRQLSAVTRTPFVQLIPDNANQSAEGALGAKEGLIFKCSARLTEAAAGCETIMSKALAVEDTVLSAEEPLELLFEPVAMVTLPEKYQAAVGAKNAGESWRSIARNILGYSPEQIAQDALDRADEMMVTMAAAKQFASMTQVQAGTGTKDENPTINTTTAAISGVTGQLKTIGLRTVENPLLPDAGPSGPVVDKGLPNMAPPPANGSAPQQKSPVKAVAPQQNNGVTKRRGR